MRLSLERQREASQVCWALVVFKRGFDILSSLYEVSRRRVLFLLLRLLLHSCNDYCCSNTALVPVILITYKSYQKEEHGVEAFGVLEVFSYLLGCVLGVHTGPGRGIVWPFGGRSSGFALVPTLTLPLQNSIPAPSFTIPHHKQDIRDTQGELMIWENTQERRSSCSRVRRVELTNE